MSAFQFLGVAALPVGALVLWFMRHGALNDLIQHTLTINARWAQEVSWRHGIQESLIPSFGIIVLAFTEVARTASGLRRQLAIGSQAPLVAGLLVMGTLAFVRAPVPYGQSFLFLVAPWAVFLGVARACPLYRRASRIERRSIAAGWCGAIMPMRAILVQCRAGRGGLGRNRFCRGQVGAGISESFRSLGPVIRAGVIG